MEYTYIIFLGGECSTFKKRIYFVDWHMDWLISCRLLNKKCSWKAFFLFFLWWIFAILWKILKKEYSVTIPLYCQKQIAKNRHNYLKPERSCFFFLFLFYFALSIWWFENFGDIFQLVLGVLFFRIHIEKRKFSKISFVFFKVATVRKRALKEKSPPSKCLHERC
jgi:hypothetical protein